MTRSTIYSVRQTLSVKVSVNVVLCNDVPTKLRVYLGLVLRSSVTAVAWHEGSIEWCTGGDVIMVEGMKMRRDKTSLMVLLREVKLQDKYVVAIAGMWQFKDCGSGSIAKDDPILYEDKMKVCKDPLQRSGPTDEDC